MKVYRSNTAEVLEFVQSKAVKTADSIVSDSLNRIKELRDKADQTDDTDTMSSLFNAITEEQSLIDKLDVFAEKEKPHTVKLIQSEWNKYTITIKAKNINEARDMMLDKGFKPHEFEPEFKQENREYDADTDIKLRKDFVIADVKK